MVTAAASWADKSAADVLAWGAALCDRAQAESATAARRVAAPIVAARFTFQLYAAARRSSPRSAALWSCSARRAEHIPGQDSGGQRYRLVEPARGCRARASAPPPSLSTRGGHPRLPGGGSLRGHEIQVFFYILSHLKQVDVNFVHCEAVETVIWPAAATGGARCRHAAHHHKGESSATSHILTLCLRPAPVKSEALALLGLRHQAQLFFSVLFGTDDGGLPWASPRTCVQVVITPSDWPDHSEPCPRTEKALDCKRNLPSETHGQGLSTQAKPMIGTAEA